MLLGVCLGLNSGYGGGPTVLLKDTFTDADGTALTAHTMDVGPGWGLVYGAPKIESNQWQGTAVNDNASSTDAGKADVTISVAFTYQTGDDYSPSIFFRLTAATSIPPINDAWWIDNRGTSWTLNERVTGGDVQRATTAYNLTGGTTYAITIVLSGGTVTLTVNGVSQFSYALMATQLTGTGIVLYTYKGGAVPGSTYDNLLVTSP